MATEYVTATSTPKMDTNRADRGNRRERGGRNSSFSTRRLLATLLAVLVGVGVLAACESTQSDLDLVRNSVNVSRAQHGIPAVAENATLNLKADLWAQQMRNACSIWHSHLADGAPGNWKKLGENVGMGGGITQVHQAYMNSPGHKANVLDRSFTEMGTAAVWGNCNGYQTVFTVHVFMKT